MYYNSFFLVLTKEAVGVSAKSMLAAVCKTFYWANYFLQTKSFVPVQGTSVQIGQGSNFCTLLYTARRCLSLKLALLFTNIMKHTAATCIIPEARFPRFVHHCTILRATSIRFWAIGCPPCVTSPGFSVLPHPGSFRYYVGCAYPYVLPVPRDEWVCKVILCLRVNGQQLRIQAITIGFGTLPIF